MTAIRYVDGLGNVITEYPPLFLGADRVNVEHTDNPEGFLAFGAGCWCGKPAVFHVTREHAVRLCGTAHSYVCADHVRLDLEPRP